MRVLVTGAGGMLGIDLCKAIRRAEHEVIATGRHGQDIQLDVTDLSHVSHVMELYCPNVVIHCAAYTKVDQAEKDSVEAVRINGSGTLNIAAFCAQNDVPICAISTDYVFDGDKADPYVEVDEPNPINAYGISKLAGERAVRDLCSKYWIVRTSWLYGVHGKSFPDTILRAAIERSELQVVNDQIGSPTYTVDLAHALIELIERADFGTYHIVNSGQTTWYGFASELLRAADLKNFRVMPISSAEWPTAAKRPANSVLGSVFSGQPGVPLLRPWQDAIADFVKERVGLIRGKM
jgi:dTDP-4-dehydrorhamnose reductase